jgi:ABC-2 type transport system ATP-binding protein
MIEAIELTKRFDHFTAVDHLSLHVAEGEVLALLGHNGAGKTTTIRCLAGILEPTGGIARIAGYDVTKEPRMVRRLVGLLTEFPGLYDRMVATEYLDFFGRMQGIDSRTIAERSERLLTHFDLWRVRDQRMGQYSKGMRQKMALVRALLHDPSILFLDEPTSALDPQSAKQVRDTIHTLRGEGRTIILCTHNLSEAELLADRIAIIARGKIRAVGTGESLMRDYMGAPLMEIRTAEPLNGALSALHSLVNVTENGQDWIRFVVPAHADTHRQVLRTLDAHGHAVLSYHEVPRSLESLYLKIVEQPTETGAETRE